MIFILIELFQKKITLVNYFLRSCQRCHSYIADPPPPRARSLLVRTDRAVFARSCSENGSLHLLNVSNSLIMSEADEDNGKKVSRIKKHHRLEMENWLSQDRVYSGGKTGAKQKNIRWCLGGGEKGIKGMTDTKECKSSGAYERMASHMNKTFSLKGADLWTSAIAEARFKNIMKAFRDACRQNPLPREKDFGSDKNAYAAALELCDDKRKKKCSSYVALWISCDLKNHPKFSAVGKMESSHDNDSDDDFEEDVRQRRQETNHDDSDSDSDSDSCASGASPGNDSDQNTKGRENPTASPSGTPRAASSPRSQTSPGAKRVAGAGVRKKVVVAKRQKFSLKKQKSTTKHQDIVEAYLICKKQQNDHFLHISILSQRRQIFFDCWDREIRNMADVQRVYDAIGIGTVPAYLGQPLQQDPAIECDGNDMVDADEGKENEDGSFEAGS
jgi:hypothetical protein